MEKEKYNLPASKLNIEPEGLPEKNFRESFAQLTSSMR